MIASGGSYYNVASGTILPAGYQQVEYIENSGTQYIDTDFYPNYNNGFEIIIEYSPTNLNTRGCLLSNYSATKHILLEINSAGQQRLYYYDNRVDRVNNNVLTTKNIGIFKYYNGTFYNILNNVSREDNYNANGSCDSSLYMFVDRMGRFTTFTNYLKIYKCIIKDGNTLVRNFIPCYRISDNEIGMYDTVNGVFYTNQGTGTFVKGPNVYNRYIVKEFDRPYISGHVTDGSSTFMFNVNNNVNITVPVDSDGNWKWYQDRAITSLNRMICFTSTTYTDNIDYLEINANLDNCTNLGVAIALSTLEKVVIKSKTALLKDISYLAQDCVNLKQFYAPNINLGSGSNIGSMFLRCANLEIVDLRNSKIITAGATTMFSGCNKLNTLLVDSIKANTKFSSSNVLPKQFIINIINAAEASITYTLHATPYAKCASGGEWYSDIQAAIDAKALEGYTVTLISA